MVGGQVPVLAHTAAKDTSLLPKLPEITSGRWPLGDSLYFFRDSSVESDRILPRVDGNVQLKIRSRLEEGDARVSIPKHITHIKCCFLIENN